MPEEVQTFEGKPKGPRKLIEEQYDQILFDFDVGEYGEVELAPDEKRISVRPRLKAAAKRRGLGLDFLHARGNLLRFHVQELDRAVPAVTSPAASVITGAISPKRRGRPKKEA